MTPERRRGPADRRGAEAAAAPARRGGLRRPDGRAGHRGAEGRDPARDRDARRDRRRDRRRGRGAAPADAARREPPRAAARHLRPGRPRPRPLQPLDGRRDRGRRARAPPSPSTATARSPRAWDRPTSSRRRGVRVDLDPATAGRVLDETGLVFLFAPAFHPAMKELGTVRRELGIRTIFNALGPLANPAGATRQLIGVGRPELVRLLADALAALGNERAIVFHSENGLDELVARRRGGRRRGARRLDASLEARRRRPCARRRSRSRSCRAATRPRTPAMLVRLLDGEAGPAPRGGAAERRGGPRRRGPRDGRPARATSARRRRRRRARQAGASRAEGGVARGMSDVLTGSSRPSRRAWPAGEYAASRCRRARPTDGARFVASLREPGTADRRGDQGEVAVGRARSSPAPTGRIESFALHYRRGHAAAISVVTEEDHFGGRPGVAAADEGHLRAAGAHEGLRRLRAPARLRGLARGRRGAPDRPGARRRRTSAALAAAARERGLAAVVEAHGDVEIRRAAAVDAGRPRCQRAGPGELRDRPRRARGDGAGDSRRPGPDWRRAASAARADVERLHGGGLRAFLVGEIAAPLRGSRGRAAER